MLLGGGIIALVEEEIKHLQDQSLVSFLSRLSHVAPFLFQDVIRSASSLCTVQEKKHRDGPCAFIPPRVPRPALYNHVATLQMQGLAFVQLQPHLSLLDNGVVDGVRLVHGRILPFEVIR
jgi:hypothetical protein